MSNRYSTFPDKLDELKLLSEVQNMTLDQKQKASRCNELSLKPSLTVAEENEFLRLVEELKGFNISSVDWNKVVETLMNTQEYIKNNILSDVGEMADNAEEHIRTYTEEMLDEVYSVTESSKIEINNVKADAISSVQAKAEELIAEGNIGVDTLKGYVVLQEASDRVRVNIPEYNKNRDILMVYINGSLVSEGVVYTMMADNFTIKAVEGTWDIGTVFNFIVNKKTIFKLDYYDVGLIEDGSISKEKLAQEVIEEIEKSSVIGNIDDTIETPVELQGKDLVSRVNETFQFASNGKTSIANALTGIGVTSSDGETFSSLASKISSIPNVGTIKSLEFLGVEVDAQATLEDNITNISIKSDNRVGVLNDNGKYEIDIQLDNGFDSISLDYKSKTIKMELPAPLEGSSSSNLYNIIESDDTTGKMKFTQNLSGTMNLGTFTKRTTTGFAYMTESTPLVATYGNDIFYKSRVGSSESEYPISKYNTVTKTRTHGKYYSVYCHGVFVYGDYLYTVDPYNIRRFTIPDVSTGTIIFSPSVDMDAGGVMDSRTGIMYLPHNITSSTNITTYNVSTGEVETFAVNNGLTTDNYWHMKGMYKDKIYCQRGSVVSVFDVNTRLFSSDTELNLTSTEKIINVIGNEVYIYNSDDYQNDRVYNLDTKVSKITITGGDSYSTSPIVKIGDYGYVLGLYGEGCYDLKNLQTINLSGFADSGTADYDVAKTPRIFKNFMFVNGGQRDYDAIYDFNTNKALIDLGNAPSYYATTVKYSDYAIVFKSYNSYDSYKPTIFNPKTRKYISVSGASGQYAHVVFVDNSLLVTKVSGTTSTSGTLTWYNYETGVQTKSSNFTVANVVTFNQYAQTIDDRYVYYTENSKLYKMDGIDGTVTLIGSASGTFNNSTVVYNNTHILIPNGTNLIIYDVIGNTWRSMTNSVSIGTYSGVDGDYVFFNTSTDITCINMKTFTLSSVVNTYSQTGVYYNKRFYANGRDDYSWWLSSIPLVGLDSISGSKVTQLSTPISEFKSYKHRTKMKCLTGVVKEIKGTFKVEV